MKNLQEKIESLSVEDRKEVEHLVERLLEQDEDTKSDSLNQSWAGALKEFREQYNTDELKKKSMEWRQE